MGFERTSRQESIAVYRSGGIGDTLLLVPLLRALRKAHPGALIRLAGRRDVGGLLRGAGLVDMVVDASDVSFGALTGEPVQPEGILAALGSPEAAVILTHRSEPVAHAFQGLTDRVTVWDPFPAAGRHAAEQALRAASALGTQTSWAGPETVEPLMPGPTRTPDPGAAIILHPGAGAAWKRWPAAHFSALAEELKARGQPVVVLAGPADEEAVERMGRSGMVVRPGTLPAAWDLLAGARAFVGNDSGMSHLAGLMGTPTVAIFGPTHPDSWRPLGPDVRTVRACTAPTEETVRVCFEPGCLEAVSVEAVLAALEEVDGRGPAG